MLHADCLEIRRGQSWKAGLRHDCSSSRGHQAHPTAALSRIEDNVFETTTLGLHLHENQSLALSIALHFLKIRNPKRPIIIDASLLGMGRIPGNLCIEQIANELNTLNLSNYCTTEIYEAIYKYIAPIKSQTPWGYSPEYMISAMSNVNRNYSEFLKDGGLPLSRFPEALNYIKQNDTFGMKFNSKLASKCLDLFKVNP